MSVNSPCIGIDFGTTNCSVAWFNPQTGQAEIIHNAEGKEKTPSLVYFGEGETLVGSAVEQKLADCYDDLQQREDVSRRVIKSIKRSLITPQRFALPGAREVRPVEVAAEILHKLRSKADELHFHAAVERAVITYPASFSARYKNVLKKAAEMAGFAEVDLLEEPVAAALAFTRMGLNVGNGVLVYDLGGGTFDAAFMVREGDSFRVAIDPVGEQHCGGDDFDQRLYDYWDEEVKSHLGRSISVVEDEIDVHFLRECRTRKEFLSEGKECNFTLSLTGGASYRFIISRDKFEELIEDEIRKTVDKTRKLSERARREGYAVETILLIGGSSELSVVRRLLSETLPVSPRKWQYRDIAVALGAAYHASRLWGEPEENAGKKTKSQGRSKVKEKGIARPKATLTVSPDGRSDFSTISEAILQAEPGTQIVVKAGVYDESLVIDKPLEIVAESAAKDAVIQNTDSNCILMQAESATLRGFKLRNNSSEQGLPYFAVDIPRGCLLLENCEVESGSAGGVAIHGMAANPIIRQCSIHDAKTAGIYVYGSGRGTIEDCDIFGNSAEGVLVKSGGNPSIRRCKFHNGKDAALFFNEGGLGTVEACDIYDNAVAGISIGAESNPVVGRCQIHHGRGVGIAVAAGGRGTIEDCEIYVNEAVEVLISESGNPSLIRCKIYDGKGVGVGAMDQGLGIIEECEIFRNTGLGVSINTGSSTAIRGCKIWGGQDSGVYFTSNSAGTLEDCDIFGHAAAEVVLDKGGNPVIARCRIHDGKLNGVVVSENAQGLIEDCDIFRHGHVGVGIADAGNPVIRRCKIRDGKNSGVFVKSNGKGTFEECEIVGNAYAGVEIREAGDPSILRCNVHHNRLGVYVYANGEGRIENCDLRDNQFGAWEITTGCKVSQNANTVGADTSHKPLDESDVKSLLARFAPQYDLYVAPLIPNDKLTKARATCHVADSERIVGLINCTFFGAAKDAVLFGLDAIYFRRSFLSEPGRIAYSEFPMLTFEKKAAADISFSNGQSFALGRSAVPVDKVILILESLKQFCENNATKVRRKP